MRKWNDDSADCESEIPKGLFEGHPSFRIEILRERDDNEEKDPEIEEF
jgi:hypothetical protein